MTYRNIFSIYLVNINKQQMVHLDCRGFVLIFDVLTQKKTGAVNWGQ